MNFQVSNLISGILTKYLKSGDSSQLLVNLSHFHVTWSVSGKQIDWSMSDWKYENPHKYVFF